MTRLYRYLRRALVALFVASACFHAAALADAVRAVPVPAWEHVVFVPVNLYLAFYVRVPGWCRTTERLLQLFGAQQILEHTYRATLELPGPSAQNVAAVVFGILAAPLWSLSTREAPDAGAASTVPVASQP